MNAKNRAADCVRSWCTRHADGDHRPEARAARLAAAMPLVHAMNLRGLDHVDASRLLEPANGKPLFLFAGPSRRRPRETGTAAVAVFRAGVETSNAVDECAASPFDSGGARDFAKMTRNEFAATRTTLTMKGMEHREYLATLLSCGFDDPNAYVKESRGPELATTRGTETAESRGLAKSLRKRHDPSCWTVEVRLSVKPNEIDLQRCEHLDCVAVFGQEHEPHFSRIEGWLGEERTFFDPLATDRTTEAGLTASLHTRDRAAREWTIRRILASAAEGEG